MICSCGRSIAYEFLEMIIEIMLLANNPRRFLFIRTCLDTYVCYVKYVMDGCTIQTKSTIYHKNYFPQKYHSMAKMWLFTSYGNKQIYMQFLSPVWYFRVLKYWNAFVWIVKWLSSCVLIPCRYVLWKHITRFWISKI